MEKKNDSAFSEIWKVLVGEAVAIGIMVIVFVIAGALTINVLWGALLGFATNMISFLALCFTVEKIISSGDKAKAMLTQRLSYLMRLGILAIGLFIGLKFEIFNNIAVIVPLVITRPTLSLFALFSKKEEVKENNAD